MGNCSAALDMSTCHALGTPLVGVIPSQAELKAEEKYLLLKPSGWMELILFPSLGQEAIGYLQKELFFP